MNMPPFIKKAEDALEGGPDYVLTGGLIIAAIVALVVAWRGSRVLKAAVLAWMIMP